MSSKLSKKQQTTESALTTFRKYCGYLLDGAISIYLILIIAVMPFYNEEGYAHIGTDKATFFRTVSLNGAKVILPLLAVWLILMAAEKIRKKEKVQVKLSVTDGFALLYVFSLILSYLCSDYKADALWGALGWYMGFVPQMILLAIYFLVSRCWKPRKWIFGLFLPVSAVVFLLGIINRFGVYFGRMEFITAGFISTIGNINWYCGYLVSVFFAGYYLLWASRKPQNKREILGQILLPLYAVIGFASLVTQGSMSGLLALAVVLAVTFFLSAQNQHRMQRFWLTVVALSGGCLLILLLRVCLPERFNYAQTVTDLFTYSFLPFIMMVAALVFYGLVAYAGRKEKYPARAMGTVAKVLEILCPVLLCAGAGMIIVNTKYPGSLGSLSANPLFTFDAGWGSDRGGTWTIGIRCFMEQSFLHKMIGVGPDGMAAFLYHGASGGLLEMAKTQFGELTLTNAHCEWLTVLVNNGIMGLAGFAGMMVSAIVRFLKGGMKRTAPGGLIAGACGLCLLAYTANNTFSFQQSMSAATIFVVLGMGECFLRER